MDMIRTARTPCSIPPCDDGPGEPCTRHETEQAHAEGEHAFCEDDCEAVDFGHRPVLGFIDGYGLVDVCARCELHGLPDSLADLRVVKWSCTTALILGLADRPVGARP